MPQPPVPDRPTASAPTHRGGGYAMATMTSTTSPAPASASRWSVLRTPLLAWTASRVLVIGLAVIVGLWWGPNSVLGIDPSVPHPLALLGSYDTSWYIDIARHGYDHYTGLVGIVYTNLAFFPLLPGIMWLGIRTSTNPFLWGFVVSNLAFLGAVVGLHRLTEDRWGRTLADRSAWVFAFAPPALYASMAYTDGLLVALAIGAGLAATRGHWYVASLAAAGAALTRPPGIVVALLVAAIALLATEDPWVARIRHAVIGVVGSALALGAFLAWMQVERGSWTLPLTAQSAWHRGALGTGIVTQLPHATGVALGDIVTPFHHSLLQEFEWVMSTRDFVFTVIYVVLCVVLWRMDGGWRSPWVIFAAAAIVVPLASGTYGSMLRFGLLAFPLVWPVAAWLEDGGRRRQRWVFAAAAVVAVLLVVQLHFSNP